MELKVWRQQRSVLGGTLANSTHAIVGVGTLTFKHLPDSNGTYKIDITDIVRVFGNGAVVTVTYYNGDTQLQQETYTLNVAGNIDPEKQVIPYNKAIAELCDLYDDETRGVILPPSYILETFTGTSMFETFDPQLLGEESTEFHTESTETAGQRPYTNPIAYGLRPGEELRIFNSDDVVLWSTRVRGRECNKRYAFVQWIGRTGIMKRATWEVVNVTDEQDDAQEMMTLQNEYDVRMGLVQKMTLRLENLNAYDYWYYSDVLTSSDVRVMLDTDVWDGIKHEILPSGRVAVTTKSIKQRNGNGGLFGTLNVEIKYRRYDRI